MIAMVFQEKMCQKHGAYKAKKICDVFGAAIFEDCPDCLREYREEEGRRLEREARENAIEAEKRLVERLKDLGCGGDYINNRFKINEKTQLLSKILPDGGKLIDFFKVRDGDFLKKDNLLLLGSCGIGKTFFACKMVDEALKIGKTYLLLAGFELVSIYQNSTKSGVLRINSAENIEECLKNVDGLIIDEIDFFLREGRTPKEKEVLEIVAYYTSKNGIRTISLGNCKAEELRALDNKVLSRLASGLVLNGWGMEDLRRNKMQEFLIYARNLIKEAEGFKGIEYVCPAGFRTIGYGRNLDKNPLNSNDHLKCFRTHDGKLSISESTANEWLTSEILKIVKECEGKEWFEYIGFERKGVVIDLIYNLGLAKWNTFKKCQAALSNNDFGVASLELEDSKWFKQVGLRGLRNVEIIKFGEKINDFYKAKN